MAGKQKKWGFESPDMAGDEPGSTPIPEASPDPSPASGGAVLRKPSDLDALSEYPISEASDESADQSVTGDNANLREGLRQSGERVKRQFSSAISRGYEAGSDAVEDFEDEMSLHPWSTFLAGALLGGIAGYLFAIRR
jgi:ElaB/YqjD/DUF883 family membrane-anchored ribosome-binding protein